MSYPMHRPIVPRTNEENKEKEIKNEIDEKVKHIDETNKEELIQKLFDDEIYKYDKQPRTYKDYIN